MTLTYLITAGPTQEPIDPVRYLSNRSSGKMGYALAEAAVSSGAQVILVTGPTALPVPEGVECHPVQTAAEMHAQVMQAVGRADIMIGAAAVADYTPEVVADEKLKKSDDSLVLKLKPTADIMADVALLESSPFTVGFAAETHNVMAFAEAKRQRKRLDMIVANDVSRTDIGFDRDDNAVTVFFDGGCQEIAKASKQQIALSLIQLIETHYATKSSS